MRHVETSLMITTSPEKIIDAFITPRQLKEWWQVERSLIVPKPGGVYTLCWNITDKGFGYVSSGIIKKIKKDLLVIRDMVYLNPERPILGPMSLTVKATSKGEKSEFFLRQDGYQSGVDWDWYYGTVNKVWPEMVQLLKEYLESR